MDLLSFITVFKYCKNLPLKMNFSESNFLDVYAVVYYKVVIKQETSSITKDFYKKYNGPSY